MTSLNFVTSFLADALFQRFSGPWPALVVAALLTSIGMLLVVRWTSVPAAVERSKNRLFARVLELVLFRHDAVVSFTAGGRILRANFAYLKTLIPPLALSLIPGVLILSQLSCWFDARPLRVGEAATIEVTLHDRSDIQSPITLSGVSAVKVETDGVRVPRRSEVSWRVRGVQPGVDAIAVHVGDERPVVKQIAVGDGFQKVSRRRTANAFWDQLLYPAEAPLDGAQSVVAIDVRYPAGELPLGNWDVHWLAAFLVLTILFALLLKRPLGVRI